MDDDGKMWFMDAGGERGPMNFQVPIHYGAFTVPEQYEPGFEIVWPESGLSDTQGGMIRVRMPVGRLNHFTAASGADVVRAHRVPADLIGDLLVTEPVGRLIRRARIVRNEGLTQLRNVYPGSEFVLSTDPLFRPVNVTTAPDGSLYIADMYHGIIQESNWTRPGSYLRRKIDQYQLDKVIAHGRIWRLRFDGLPAYRPPRRARPRRRRRRFPCSRRWRSTRRVRACSTKRWRSSSPTCATRTGGGVTPRSNFSCSGRTSPSCRRS